MPPVRRRITAGVEGRQGKSGAGQGLEMVKCRGKREEMGG